MTTEKALIAETDEARIAELMKKDLRELIVDYFSLGVAEGREGRAHDTIDGAAQMNLHVIEEKIAALERRLEEAGFDLDDCLAEIKDLSARAFQEKNKCR
jgi:ferritin-like protein